MTRTSAGENALGQHGSKCVTVAPWKSPMMAAIARGRLPGSLGSRTSQLAEPTRRFLNHRHRPSVQVSPDGDRARSGVGNSRRQWASRMCCDRKSVTESSTIRSCQGISMPARLRTVLFSRIHVNQCEPCNVVSNVESKGVWAAVLITILRKVISGLMLDQG